MEFDVDNVREVVEEDRLSSLPDHLIHKIMSSFDMPFVIQTRLLSSRWKFLWTSMTYLNFRNDEFYFSEEFVTFVKYVLSRRNHQAEVSSVKLIFSGPWNQNFVEEIANYGFSRNIQELNVLIDTENKGPTSYFLRSSHSLKHLELLHSPPISFTPEARFDFPALATLHLSNFRLRDFKAKESVNLFSKCVNLKKLTLEYFCIKAVGVFDIITPRLSDLKLIGGKCSKTINLIAPELRNLKIMYCLYINYLNISPRLSSFCYTGRLPLKWFNDRFYSLNEASIWLNYAKETYNEDDALKTINILQKLHSAKYLTLNVNIIECISSFPELLSHLPSPFCNLIHLTIDSPPPMYCDSQVIRYEVITMSTEVRNFFLESSPSATLIMKVCSRFNW